MSNKKLKTPINPNAEHVCSIVTDYDELSIRSDEFDLAKHNSEVQKTVIKLKNTIRANPGMIGLSAPQIGVYRRIVCLNFNGDIRTFINPIITKANGFELSRETCHSIPNKTFIRTRHNNISITYQTPLGKIESVTLFGVAAKEMQHLIDHLDGLLLSDVSLEIDDAFDNATEEERAEVIKYYLEALDLQVEDLNQQVSEDPDAKQLQDAIRFIESVNKGETIIESVPYTDEEFNQLKEQVKAEIDQLEKELKDNG